MSIMTEITAKGTGEVGSKVIVIFPLTHVVLAPLGVLIPLVLVAPSRLVLLGVISALTWVVIVLVFSFLFGIIRLMGWIFRIQLFKILILMNGRGLNKIHPGVRVSFGGAMGCGGPGNGKYELCHGNDS
jgi:hypothetical protein